MSIPALFITTKRLGRAAWAYAAAAAVGVGIVLWWWLVLRPRDDQVDQLPRPVSKVALDQARVEVRDRLNAANAQAAVELAVAETKSAALREQLVAIKQDRDAARRRRSIIAMAERVEKESPGP